MDLGQPLIASILPQQKASQKRLNANILISVRKKLQILLISAHGIWKKHGLKAFIAFVLLLLPIASFLFYYFGKIYPGVSVNGVAVGGKTLDQVVEILSTTITTSSEVALTTSAASLIHK